jgi:hypothetical protein
MASPFSGSAGRKAAVDAEAYWDSIWRDQKSRIKSGEDRSLSALRTGFNTAGADIQRATGRFDPYVTTGLAALGGYTDAIGMNGAEGNDRAVAAFRAGPGYEWAVDQATDAVARKAGAIGALGSGNTMAAISDRAGHMADQEFDDYLDRLNGVVGLGYNATTAQAGLDQDLANLRMQYGRDRAGTIGSFTGMGVNARQGTAGNIAEARTGGLMAGQNAAANRWNMGMSLAGLGADFLGGGGLKNLKSLFA